MQQCVKEMERDKWAFSTDSIIQFISMHLFNRPRKLHVDCLVLLLSFMLNGLGVGVERERGVILWLLRVR